MKYEVKFTNQFKKDLKLAKKQNRHLDKLFDAVNILADGGTLDAKYRDHELSGNYKGTRECHIEPAVIQKGRKNIRHFLKDDENFLFNLK